jgi:hypothetical protein
MFNTLELYFRILRLPNIDSVLVGDGKKRPQPLTPDDFLNLGLSYPALRHLQWRTLPTSPRLITYVASPQTLGIGHTIVPTGTFSLV